MLKPTRQLLTILLFSGAFLLAAWLFVSLLKGLLILFAGILFGVFLNQLSRRVAKLFSIPYQAGFAIVVSVLLVLFCGTTYLMGSQITASVKELIQEFNTAQQQFFASLNQYRWWNEALDTMQDGRPSGLPMQAVSTATSAATSLLVALSGTVLVFFLGFYFALQPEVFHDGLLQLFPVERRKRIADILDRLTHTLWQWLLGRLVGMTVIGVCSAIGLWILGIPLPATLGCLAGVLTFIPNLGPLLSVIPPVLFGLQQGGHAWLYVLIFYLVLQFLESYFLTPLITQQQVGLPPGLILASQLLFGMLAGFMGLLLATPLTATIQVLVVELHVKRLEQEGSH